MRDPSDEAPSSPEPSPSDASATAGGAQELNVGDRVRLTQAPSYFKTADPMPMLRPPDAVPPGEVGLLTEQRTGKTWVVRFEQGSFLLDTPYLAKADE